MSQVAPTTDCTTCGRSARECSNSAAKGWDGCCMACDARGRRLSHQLHLVNIPAVKR